MQILETTVIVSPGLLLLHWEHSNFRLLLIQEIVIVAC